MCVVDGADNCYRAITTMMVAREINVPVVDFDAWL